MPSPGDLQRPLGVSSYFLLQHIGIRFSGKVTENPIVVTGTDVMGGRMES